MKGHLLSGWIRISRKANIALVMLGALMLAACGGGGGSSSSNNNQNNNSNVRMTVSPMNDSVSALTTQPAPNSYPIQVNVTGLTQGQTIYLGGQYSGQGISSLDNPGGTLPATITINFDSPASLGAGTYKASIKIEVCLDQNCAQQIANSPQNVNVTYKVTQSTFAINGLNPSSAYAGAQTFLLTVNGSTFTQQSSVYWNNAQLATNFVNSSQLTAQIPAPNIIMAGAATITVGDPNYGTTNSESFTIDSSPVTVTALSPSSINGEGPAFTLTLTGTSFTSQSSVLWNGNPITTNFVSTTQLTAQIPASDIYTPGTATVAVNDPMYGNSNSQTFTINTPPLTLSLVSPTTVTVGGSAFTLTALGKSFTGTSTVEWNGTALVTTQVSPTEILAQVPASDISATGTASVMVSDPNSPPGTTGAKSVTIVPPSIDAVTFQMNPVHTGAVNFSSVNFPGIPTWTKNVGGIPSYALIADGEVIVTVQLSAQDSEVLALDQATGNTVWGPISINGKANAAYDNGRVFVASSPYPSPPILQAFDAASGTLDWSTTLNTTGDPGAPTATAGVVYLDSEYGLQAFDESSGTLLWTYYSGAGFSTPAVTADGIYVSFPCLALDVRPATGEQIWRYQGNCEGGGATMPAIINQLDYSADNFPYYVGSLDVLDAKTGSYIRSYLAASPPAYTNTMGYFLQSGTLNGILLLNNTVQWSFTGDGQLAGAPIAVNQYVIIGSSSGNLYALDGSTGTQLWNVDLGTAIDTNELFIPFSGLAAGNGLLVVPAGNSVVAYTLSTNP